MMLQKLETLGRSPLAYAFLFSLILVTLWLPECAKNKFQRRAETKAYLLKLRRASRAYLSHNAAPRNMIELIDILGFRDTCNSSPGIEKGMDSWGNGIILQVVSEGAIKFRSMGKNGIDDNGANDDIEVDVDLLP